MLFEFTVTPLYGAYLTPCNEIGCNTNFGAILNQKMFPLRMVEHRTYQSWLKWLVLGGAQLLFKVIVVLCHWLLREFESIHTFNKISLYGILGKLARLSRRCICLVLSVGPIPTHIAFIMDGNRRYARKCKLTEGSGYRVGILALMSMVKYCCELGVKYVTVYAFSIDNFKRSPEEVRIVMDLMQEEIEEMLKVESVVNSYGVRIHFIGNLKLLSEPARLAAERAMAATAKNSKFVLLVCVAYASTHEIVHAVEECSLEKQSKYQELDSSRSGGDLIEDFEVACNGNHHEPAIKLSDLERHMYMSVAPDVDILVRTSGAKRLSNFLLWQSTYSYLYSPLALWPEISLWHLVWMVLNYQHVRPTLEKMKKQC